jgi:hypothetical protein
MKNLKRLMLMPLMVLVVLFGSGNVWGQSAGFNNTFIVLSLNGGANAYYDLNAATANTDFNTANLGSFAAGSSSLILKGAEHNVYKCGSSDLSSTRLNYRIYLTASPSGAYTAQSIGYSSGFGNGCGGQDQLWSNTGLSTNLLTGLGAGAYTIEVYSDATVTNCCGGTVFASNSGSNYKATFTIIGNFYSKSTGSLETLSNWGSNTDGTGTAPANFTSNGVTFNIRNNATPTIGASWTVSGSGSKIVVGDGTNACNFSIGSNYVVTSTATDVSNNGTITRTTSGGNSWGTLTFASGAKYVHNINGGTLPTATWNSNSTLQIDQSVSDNEFTETFGNVTINGSSSFSMYNSSSSTTMNIAGNLTFNSSGTVYISGPSCNNTQTLNLTGNYLHTGSGSFIVRKYTSNTTFSVSGNFTMSNGIFTLGAPSGTSNYNGTLNITSNLTISAGQFNIHKSNGSSNSINNTVNVTGNFEMSGGGLLFSDETGASISSNAVYALLNVKGNFTHTSGTISETASDGDVITRVTLNGTTGTQTLESTGQTGIIDFNVAASGAQCVIAASKTFTLSTASKMTVGAGTSAPDLSVSGIFVNSSTTTLGTTATTGTWAINNGGNFVHNSSAGISTPLDRCTLNSGSTFTYRGNGTPSAITPSTSLASGRTYHHLIFESTSGAWSATANSVTALIVNGNLTVGSGVTLNFSNTGTPTPANSIKGNLSVAGTLNFSPASAGTVNLNGSSTQTISGAGTITTGSNATLAVGASSTIDFGATIAIAGSGTFTTASGSTLITANTSGINGSLTLSNKSLNAGTNYTFNGSSAQVTGNLITAAGNLTLNNSNGLTLSAGTSVTGILTLTNGKLTLGASDFTLGAGASVSGVSSTKYIVTNSTGQLKKASLTSAFLFPVGNSAYNPISLTNSGTSDTYGILVTDGAVADATVSGECVNRRWYITEGTSGGGNLTVAPQYNTGETGASYTTGSQVYLGLYVPTTWTKTAATVTGTNPFTASAAGFNQSLSSTSYIAIGNEGIYMAAPTVTTTVAASSITNTTTSSGGQTLSGTNITSKGVVWNTATAPTVSLSTKTNDGTGTANFTSSLTSLSPQTLYYIRAYVTNAAGTGYGDEKTFRTLSNPATVQASGFSATTTSASNIDLSWTGATFPVSGATNKNYVLLRAASPNSPLLGNSNGAAPTAGANTTIVSSVIAENATSISSSGLAASTQYNYLLVPYTWDGTNATTYNYLTTSAPTANATTQSGSTPPVLTTNTASSVLSTTATLNGEITADGGASVTARGFVYSTSDNTPTIGEGGVTDQASGSGTGTFNSGVTSLSPNTTYYYQAYATNTSGTSYGGVISFTTLKAEPSAQATSLVFSSVATTSFSTAFTAATGSPDGYIVIRSTSSSLSADPVDGTTYTAGNSLGGGTVVSVGSSISGISSSSLSAGTTYYTFVFAYNNSGSNIDYRTTSPLSGSTITLTDAPATPTFSSITTSGFTVDWTATTGASSYRLDVSTASDFSSYVSGYQDLTVNGTSQAVTGLTANTLYYARIRAVNNSGTSANSTSGNSATLSNAPAVSTASSITTSGLTANWTAPSSQGAVTFTYTVELSTNSSDFSSPVSTASSIALGTTTNAFSSLSEGTTYYYRIKAVNSSGSSAWSSVSVGATTLTSSISLTALGTSSTQNFNTLATSGTSSTLPSGWYLSESGTNANSTLTAGSGSGSGGDTYSFGTGTNSDRAFGGLRSGSLVPVIGAKFVNNTGSTISNLEVSFTGEQWRLGATGRVDRLDFQYSFDATSLTTGTWTDFNSLDFTAPITSGATGAIDGNASANRSALTAIISSLSITNGAVFLIRWTDFSASGANDGLAIDDFSIKPCGTVSEPTASNQAFCSATSPTVASLTATGTAPQWYSASTGGTALSTSTALTNSTTYYATQTIDGCESVSRTPVVVTINTNPSAPTGNATQTLCSGATVAELSATGTAIQWYVASSGGSALATNTALVNSSTYYASQTTNSCESSTRFAATAAIVSSGSWIGGTSTDWSNAANWCGGVPSASTSVTVVSGTTYSPVVSTSISVNSLTINSGATLSTSGTPTITIANNGSFTNNGTFTSGSSKVSFAGNGTVSGTVAFNDVDIAGGVNFGTASTVNGTLSMNAGSFINTNAPIYGSGSTLKYNTGGTYGRSTEWSTTSGAGAPYSVQLSNNTTLNYPNSANGGANAFSTNLSLAGNLTVDNGSSLYMDYGGSSNKSGRLDISGNVLLNGNLSLGNASGGDIKVGGNWTRNSGSTLNTNNRAVFFTGNGTSTITGNGGETFTYMVNEKTGGSISLGNNLTLTAPNGGNALTHKSTASIDLNNYSLTFSGPDNSTILADGACLITGTGNVLITSNTKNLTGQNSGSWTFGSNVNLKLQSGLNFGTNLSTVNGTLEISSGGFVSGDGRPSYGVGSTLKYNSTGTYGRNTEWLSGFSSGAGVPYNVLISAGTILDPGANSNSTSESWVRNELSVDGTFDMSLTDQVEPINVLGNVIFNNGGLTLSTSAGGDIKVGGNWSGTGTFTPNSRAVFFNGTGNQTISRNDNFPYLFVNKASGTLTFAGSITLNNKLTYTDGSITLSAGSIDASGESAEVEFANSSPYTLPTGLFSGNVNKLILNGSGGITLNDDLTLTGNLTLTNGDISIGAKNLILGSSATVSSASASSHINATSTGEARKIYSGSGSFVFPVGDGTNYTPATVNFTSAGSFNGETTDYLGVRLKTTKVTNMNSNNTSYINRSWFIEPHNSASGFTYTVNLSYTDNDVVGTESEIRPVKLSSGVWQYPGDASFDDGTQLTGTSGSINTSTDVLTWSGLTSFSEFGGGGQGGPLPVELTSFSASCEEDIVTLSWSTASEQNSSHFDVEKSNDGSAWRVIGSISAAGNSTQDINYSFVDSEKSNDQNYYRLNQVDIDGKNKLYDPIFVDCEGNASQLITYPNPSKDGFNIVISDSKLVGESILIIRDAMGKVVLRKSISIEEGTNLFPIAANEIENGVYFITIENANNDSEPIKHVKN